MKTYVFGAGASFHAHYPLASKLWPSVEGWVRKEPLAHIYRSAADNLNELFDTSKPFEMFLTELDDRISHTSDRSLVSLRNHAGGRATLTGKYNAGLSWNVYRNHSGVRHFSRFSRSGLPNRRHRTAPLYAAGGRIFIVSNGPLALLLAAQYPYEELHAADYHRTRCGGLLYAPA